MHKTLKNLTLSAMLLTVGLVLPLVTGQIPQIGKMLLPMHIPVLLCGLICGWQYGLAIGFIFPLMRSLMFGVPVIFPSAAAMSAELAVYGLAVGLFYSRSKWKCIIALYRSLIAAMLCGRIVWGAVSLVFFGIKSSPFTLNMFIGGAFINAVPGIVIQLILIPAIMLALSRTKLIPPINMHNMKRHNDV